MDAGAVNVRSQRAMKQTCRPGQGMCANGPKRSWSRFGISRAGPHGRGT